MITGYCCTTELRNGWHIISPIKSFTVYAATAMEKADWMMHINRCVQDLHLKSMIFSFHTLSKCQLTVVVSTGMCDHL